MFYFVSTVTIALLKYYLFNEKNYPEYGMHKIFTYSSLSKCNLAGSFRSTSEKAVKVGKIAV